MRITKEPLQNKEQTGRRMHDLVERYAHDLRYIYCTAKRQKIPVSRLPLLTYHRLIRSIPYRRDTAPVEVVARPYRAFERAAGGLDCKKKAILVASWARENNIPYRFVASSSRADRRIHHVYPELWLRGRWVNADATYRHYMLGARKTDETAREVL